MIFTECTIYEWIEHLELFLLFFGKGSWVVIVKFFFFDNVGVDFIQFFTQILIRILPADTAT